MKNYSVIADTKPEQIRIVELVKELQLEERLHIVHSQGEPGTCSLEVSYKISDGSDLVRRDNYPNGGLLVHINTNKPRIQFGEAKWVYISYGNEEGHIASFGLEDTLIMIYSESKK